jgi:hypothetical protein
MNGKSCDCLDCNAEKSHTDSAYTCSKCGCQLEERHTYHVEELPYCQDCLEDMSFDLE